MQRITVSLSDTLSAELDATLEERGYSTRSEAVRDLVRDGIERWTAEAMGDGYCIANVSYVFDRRIRSLGQRLTEMQNARHDLVAASMAVRLDHFHSMESVMLKGTVASVRAFADQIRAQRGVRSAAINLLRVETNNEHDAGAEHSHVHDAHLSPIS